MNCMEILRQEEERYNTLKDKIKSLLQTPECIGVEEYLKEAEELCDEDSELYRLFAWYYIKADQYDEAMKYLKKAESINNREAKTFISMGSIYERRGEYEECLKCLDRAMNLRNEDFNNIYYARGQCYYDMGDMVQAKKYFLKSYVLYSFSCDKYLKNIDKYLKGKTKKKIEFKIAPLDKRRKKFERKNKIKKITNRIPKIIKYFFFIMMILVAGVFYGIYSLTLKKLIGRKEIKKNDDFSSLKNKTRVVIKLKDLKNTGYYKMNDGRILTEEQVESDNLWAGVKSGINYGSFEDKNILFCNCIVGLRCKEGLELIGQANYIDKEIYKEIIEKYNIDEDKILIEGK